MPTALPLCVLCQILVWVAPRSTGTMAIVGKIQALFTQCLALGYPLITTGCLAFRSKLGSLPIAQYLLVALAVCQYLDLCVVRSLLCLVFLLLYKYV